MQTLNLSAALPEILLLIAACVVLLVDVLRKDASSSDIRLLAIAAVALPFVAPLMQFNQPSQPA